MIFGAATRRASSEIQRFDSLTRPSGASRSVPVAVERRGARRAPARALVALCNGGAVRWAHALDISETGMFLRTFLPLALEEAFRVDIDLAGGESTRAWARAVQQDAVRDGYDVKFIKMDETGRERLRRFVARSGMA